MDSAGKQKLKQRLERFYQHYAPEKLSNLDQVVETYAARENELFVALTKKYGPEPEVAGVIPGINKTVAEVRAIVVKYFTAHSREKLDTVDAVMAKYRGMEVDLLNALQAKYGPVPDGSQQSQDPSQRPRSSTPPPASATSNDLGKAPAAPRSVVPEIKPRPPRDDGLAAKRAVVDEYFRRFVPDKLNTVDSLMVKYQGKEDSLVAALHDKYGPLPADWNTGSATAAATQKREPVVFEPKPRAPPPPSGEPAPASLQPAAPPVAVVAPTQAQPNEGDMRYRASTSFEAQQAVTQKKSARFSDEQSPRASQSAVFGEKQGSTSSAGQTVVTPQSTTQPTPSTEAVQKPQPPVTPLQPTEPSPLIPKTTFAVDPIPVAASAQALVPEVTPSAPSQSRVPVTPSPAPVESSPAAPVVVAPAISASPSPSASVFVPKAIPPPVLPPVPNVTAGMPEVERERQNAVTRARLIRFYRHYAPEKVSQVDVALRAYRGREAVMFELLEAKYGPEAAVYEETEDTEESRLRAMVNASLATSPNSKIIGDGRGGRSGDDKAFDVVVAAKLLGSHVDVGVLGPGNEKLAASIILMLNAIGHDALFDATQATLPMPTFNAREITALDRYAFEKVLHFRFIWIDAWFRGLEIRNMELAARRHLAEQMAAECRHIQYQEYVLRQAIKLIGPIETERRSMIAEEEQLRFAGTLSWFRSRRDEILLARLAQADSLVLRADLLASAANTARARVHHRENAEIVNVLRSAGSLTKSRSPLRRSPLRDNSPPQRPRFTDSSTWTSPTARDPGTPSPSSASRRDHASPPPPPVYQPPSSLAVSPPSNPPAFTAVRTVPPALQFPLPQSAATASGPKTAVTTHQRTASPVKLCEGFLTQARRVAGARGLFSQHGAPVTGSSRTPSVRSNSGY